MGRHYHGRLRSPDDDTCSLEAIQDRPVWAGGLHTGVFVGRSGNEICPITVVTEFVAIRSSNTGPFFAQQNGLPLTKQEFVDGIRAALQALELPSKLFTGHSFRIGAATAVAQAGLEDSTIQALGRWSSSAFLRYIQTPRQQLACYTAQLATNH